MDFCFGVFFPVLHFGVVLVHSMLISLKKYGLSECGS